MGVAAPKPNDPYQLKERYYKVPVSNLGFRHWNKWATIKREGDKAVAVKTQIRVAQDSAEEAVAAMRIAVKADTDILYRTIDRDSIDAEFDLRY
jgi:hypothetical protein